MCTFSANIKFLFIQALETGRKVWLHVYVSMIKTVLWVMSNLNLKCNGHVHL